MRLIELHVDAVLDPRHVDLLQAAFQQKGRPCTVKTTTVPASRCVRLRATCARWLLLAESRILSWMGRSVPPGSLPLASVHPSVTRGDAGLGDLLVHVQMPESVARPGFPSLRPFISVTFPKAWGSDLAGLREVCAKDEVTSVVIQVWQPGDVAPQVCDIKIKTMFTFALMHDVLMRKTMHMVADCALRMEQGLPLPAGFSPAADLAPIGQARASFELQGLLLLLLYTGSMAFRMVGKALSRAVGMRAQWQLQLSRSGWRQHGPANLTPLSNPAAHYRADPFVVSHGGRTVILAEEYPNVRQMGHIMALEVLPSGQILELGVCLQEPFHLSFPYVFKCDGQLYMCPESNEASQIRVYRCVEFPLHWELDTVIMEGVAACDTVLFERDGLWWMMTNMDSSGTNTDFCSELHLFWADHPLSKDWHAHPLNPVVCDGRHARNGGFLREGDRIYRVAQGHAYGVYGKSHTVYEITTLTQTAYVETLAHRNQPPHDTLGSHHLSSNGEWTVSDSLRLSRT